MGLGEKQSIEVGSLHDPYQQLSGLGVIQEDQVNDLNDFWNLNFPLVADFLILMEKWIA